MLDSGPALLDLAPFALSPATTTGDLPYWRARRDLGVVRGLASGASFTFSRGTEHWVGYSRGGGPDSTTILTLQRFDDRGNILESHAYVLTQFTLNPTLSGVAAPDGTILLLNQSESPSVHALDLSTDTVRWRIAVPPRMTALAVDDGKLYVAGLRTIRVYRLAPMVEEIEEVDALDDLLPASVPEITISGLAVRDGRMLVSSTSPEIKAILLDVRERRFMAWVEDVPHRLASGNALGSDAESFFALDEMGTWTRFALEQPTHPRPRTIQAYTFALRNARAVAITDQRLWILFQSFATGPALVAYDPLSAQPVGGFSLGEPFLQAMNGPSKGDAIGLAAIDDALYIAVTSVDSLSNPSLGSQIFVLDATTGERRGGYSLPEPIWAMCADSSSLWVIGTPGISPLRNRAPADGADLQGLAFPLSDPGFPKLLCGRGAIALSSDTTRLWTSYFEEPRNGRSIWSFVLPEDTVGASGVVGPNGDLWLLDRSRNLLIHTSSVANLEAP